jgi:CHAD domain-containing protein
MMNPTSHAHARAHAGRWLHRLLTQLVQQSARDIRKVPRWEEQGVHCLRKRMKKLQAMLHLALAAIPESTMRAVLKDVRELKNLLSSQRDALILAKLAEELDFTMPAHQAKFTPTAGKLKKAISLSEQLLIDISLLDLTRLDWKTVAVSFAKSYKSSRKAWQDTQDDPSPEKLHQWRKKVKRLYYQSTALEPWLHHPKQLRRARKLGSLLGHCHDLDVFTSAAKSGTLQPSGGWKSKVKSRRSTLLSRIERRAAKAFSRPAQKIKVVTRRSLA